MIDSIKPKNPLHEYTNTIDLQDDKLLKAQFLATLGKAEFSNIENLKLTNLEINDKEIEIIVQAIESRKVKNMRKLNFSNY